jgi:hypothetical protein
LIGNLFLIMKLKLISRSLVEQRYMTRYEFMFVIVGKSMFLSKRQATNIDVFFLYDEFIFLNSTRCILY